MGKTQNVGSLGEDLAEKFLVKRGYRVVHRNYWRPWGEIDIVATKKGALHFVEVKTLSNNEGFVSSETSTKGDVSKVGLGSNQSHICNQSEEKRGGVVTHETSRLRALEYVASNPRKDKFRAEDKVDAKKIKRLRRVIQTYLSAEHVSDETNWQFDVVTVYVDIPLKTAKVKMLSDVGL